MTVDNDGKFAPVLAAEVPSAQNGGLAADGKSVTYKLKPGVKWADGKPFSADDVAFTFQFISDPASSAVTAGTYANVASVEAVDPGTVKITFKDPTGGWYVPFVGAQRPDPAEAHHEGLRRREVPRGAAQHQADRHRPVHGGRLQAGRPGHLQAEPELPRCRQGPVRADRAEGRRRRDLGGALGLPDRRVRLRLEPPGRGAGPEPTS